MAREALESKKGEAIAVLDVRGRSPLTDYFIVATGSSAPHLKALAEEVLHTLKASGLTCYRRSGTPDSGWIVLDFVDLVIHILTAEARRYYAIETLWEGAPRAVSAPG